MSPRPDVSEDRKHQILQAAMNVFSRLGFHRARMEDIAETAGLSKGALYWYFDSKDEIITAILSGIFDKELDVLRDLQVAEGTASQRILEFTRLTLLDFKGLLRWMPIVYEFYAVAFRQKVVRDALKGYFRRYFELVVPLIEQGVAKGEFRQVDVAEAAIAMGAIVEGTILLWVYDPDSVDMERNMLASMKMLLEGLKVSKD